MNDELERILRALRRENPSNIDIAKWKAAVAGELPRSRAQTKRWLELVAAMVVGLTIGAAVFHSATGPQENIADSATVEFVVTKSR
jgi:hypothetical protein